MSGENEDKIEKVESHQEIDEEHYLPHRPVFKENSTTKVRPVFDGSAKEKNSPSINDCLEKGPNLIELIPSLINRFRFGKFGYVVSTVKKKLDKLIVESQEILEEGKFELRGWEHNNLDPQTENTVPTERRSVPVLGLKWDLDQDLLSVDIKVHESKNEILTKRKILSLVHKIFDPIGFTCPVTLIPKIMLQECWTLKVKWDSELPASIWQNSKNGKISSIA
ncbi:uncharacterized protein TNCV_1387531 [Trichonephila clavipes]|nr:uncharacterized protein TNCV_1387531 [Trichonephila clavipes]